MMAEISWHGGNNYAPTVYLTVTQESQSVTGNCSTVKYSLTISRPSNISSSANKWFSISVNGGEVANGNTTIGGKGDKTISEGTITVYHDGDGSKEISFSFSLQLNITWKEVWLGTAENSGSMRLDTIPRASEITGVSCGVLGEELSVKLDVKSPYFRHELYYRLTPNFWTDWWYYTGATEVVNGAMSFTPGVVDSNYITTSEQSAGEVRVITYNSNWKYIGERKKSFTISVPQDIVPEFSGITCVPTTSGKLGVGFDDKYIQGLSGVKVKFSGLTGAYGSTIRMCEITLNGSTKSAVPADGATECEIVSDVIKATGDITVTAKIYDSRGRSAEKSETIHITEYNIPYLENVYVKRCDADGLVTNSGTYLKCHANVVCKAIDGVETVISVSIKRIRADTYGEPVTVLPDTETIIGAGTVAVSHSYDIKFEVSDTFTDVLKNQNNPIYKEVETDTVLFHGTDGVGGAAIGKYAEYEKAVQIPQDWKYMVGDIPVVDFIIEQGTNSEADSGIVWHYEKWYSGKYVCWGKYTSGDWYYTDSTGIEGLSIAFKSVSLPITLTCEPTAFSSVSMFNFTEWSNASLSYYDHEPDFGEIVVRIYVNTSRVTRDSYSLYLYVIGRWK